MEIFLFALMRAAMPYNDRLKFMPWIVGSSGAGKTEIFQWILQQLLGRSYVQVLQDGAHVTSEGQVVDYDYCQGQCV